MAIESGQTSNLDGLRTALDIVVSPQDALRRLRERPTWGWALLLVIVLYALASWALGPALVHATQADWPNVLARSPQLAAESSAQQRVHLEIALKIVGFSWAITPFIVLFGVLLQSVIMAICNLAGRGSAPFRTLWALAVNIGIPLIAINGIVTTIIVLVRGSQTFDSAAALQSVVPSLGYLAPSAPIKLHAFLTFFNPFTLWGAGLVVAGMTVVASLSRVWAWTTGAVWLIVNALLVAFLAR